ncbi:MAG: hypothetical protein EXS17_06615 [Phycisphaerales bacterium]|nr:hypothetical protein [Phycisphaerales bacterium]
MITTNWLVALLTITAQDPTVPALIPVRSPATAATQEAASDDGPIDLVPPTSKCSKDRRLAHTLRYATLPLNGSVGDSSITEALAEFLKRTPATNGVNALVIQFNLTGGEHDATLALAAQIVQVRNRMPVIGVFGSCVGVGAILPVVCDYLVVLDPASDATVLEWSPAQDVSDAGISVETGKCFEAIMSRAADRTFMKAVVAALLDPRLDLYLWRGSDGCSQT